MPRAKDAPAQTGGQINPYVTSTMQMNKQMSENRVLTAMKEAGATERAGIASSTQLKSQQMQGQQQIQAQAAQSAADDKRAAEAERGRREDMKFTEAMQESNQVFTAKQAELAKEHGMAMVKGDRAYAEKVRDKQEALRRFEIEKQTAAQERSTNAILSVLKGGMQRESSKEKALTVLSQEAEKFDKDKEVYERTKTRVTEKASSDRRLDLPIKGEYTVKAVRPMGIGGIPQAGPRELVSGTQADPMGVLQDQLNNYQVKISVEDLAPENINKLEDSILNGTISAEEIRSTLGVLEGMKDVLKQRRKDNPLKTDEAAYDFWNNSYQTVIDMRNAVEGLAKSQKKIEGQEKETVGSRVQYALGVIRDTSLGGRAARLRELTQGDFGAVFDEMTKAIEVPSLWTIDPEMTPYEQEIRQEENAMMSRLYPDLGGVE